MQTLALPHQIHKQHKPARSLQRGLSLIESLIALLVLALGILGLVGAQTRMLVETRTTNSRATAIRQIVDLGERIKINRSAALDNKYNANAWKLASTTAPDDCDDDDDDDDEISVGDIATCDVWRWRKSLEHTLPAGRGTITRIAGTNQLRIVVAWQLNEKNNAAIPDSFTVTDAAGNSLCPGNFICHIQFLEI